MQRKRIHNDIEINWSITRDGAPEDFSGRKVSVRLVHAYGMEAKITYTIEGNVIKVIFAGKDQLRTGQYTLVLTENEGGTDMCEIDHVDVVRLVEHTKDQGGESCSNIDVRAIDLRGEISTPTYAVDAYTKEESDKRYQPIGNYADNMVKVAQTETSVTLNPNTYNTWENVITTLTLNNPSFEGTDEYVLDFTTGETIEGITLSSSLTFAQNFKFEPNKHYVISIVNNLAVGGAF